MLNTLLDSLSKLLLDSIDKLPDVTSFNVPDGVYDGIQSIFSMVGWIMPYYLYLPLITFILSLTAFRIVYAVYLHFKR